MTYLEQAFNAEIVTPNNNSNITLSGGTINAASNNGACLYIGTGGKITVTMLGGQKVTFHNVVDGTFMPIQVQKVWATDTDASDILALY
jgi:hypothetical protein